MLNKNTDTNMHKSMCVCLYVCTYVQMYVDITFVIIVMYFVFVTHSSRYEKNQRMKYFFLTAFTNCCAHVYHRGGGSYV